MVSILGSGFKMGHFHFIIFETLIFDMIMLFSEYNHHSVRIPSHSKRMNFETLVNSSGRPLRQQIISIASHVSELS